MPATLPTISKAKVPNTPRKKHNALKRTESVASLQEVESDYNTQEEEEGEESCKLFPSAVMKTSKAGAKYWALPSGVYLYEVGQFDLLDSQHIFLIKKQITDHKTAAAKYARSAISAETPHPRANVVTSSSETNPGRDFWTAEKVFICWCDEFHEMSPEDKSWVMAKADIDVNKAFITAPVGNMPWSKFQKKK
jgi:hypothetical protein